VRPDSDFIDANPGKAIAAETLRHNVDRWKENRDRPPGRKPALNSHSGAESHIDTNACTGHSWNCDCRHCLVDWFLHHPVGHEGYLSFALCCDTLGLNQQAVLERLGLR